MRKRLIALLISGVVLLAPSTVSLASQHSVNHSTEVSDASLREAYRQLQTDYSRLEQKYRALLASTQENTVPETEPSVPPSTETNDLESQLDVVEYSMMDSYGAPCYVLVIKNNSPYTLQINANCIAKDSDGKLIGANTLSQEAVESGFEACLVSYFYDTTNASSFEYGLSAKIDNYYQPVLSDLEYEVFQADTKAVISCTNVGEEAAMFPEATALFFRDGALIGYDTTYFTMDDSTLPAGKTLTKEVNNYEAYDEIKVYFSGRK